VFFKHFHTFLWVAQEELFALLMLAIYRRKKLAAKSYIISNSFIWLMNKNHTFIVCQNFCTAISRLHWPSWPQQQQQQEL